MHCPRRAAALPLEFLGREPSIFGEGGTTCERVSKGRVMTSASLCQEVGGVMAKGQEVKVNVEVSA